VTTSKRHLRRTTARHWPGGPDQLCITTRAILEGRADVMGVVHDHYGWQFLDGDPVTLDRLVRACLHHVVEADVTLAQVKGLALHREAWREHVGGTWVRGSLPPESDEF
jgi:hypothetical protein